MQLSNRAGTRQPLASERGQELVEFAVSSVLFFTLLFLVLEGGIMLWRYNMLSNFAQAGARWAAVRGSTSSAFTNVSYGDLQSYVQGLDAALSVTTTPASTNPRDLAPGDTITVNVSRPMPASVAFFTLNGTLRASASMVVAR